MPFWVPGSFHPMLQAKCCNQFVGPKGNDNNQHSRSFFTSDLLELSIKSPSIHPVFGPPFTSYPHFQWYPQSHQILLNLSMKCWNSAFNAQRLIIIGVQKGAVKIYLAAVEALRQKERQDETQSTTKFDGFFFLVSPSVNPNVFFSGF
jgi:hypothetical protein